MTGWAIYEAGGRFVVGAARGDKIPAGRRVCPVGSKEGGEIIAEAWNADRRDAANARRADQARR